MWMPGSLLVATSSACSLSLLHQLTAMVKVDRHGNLNVVPTPLVCSLYTKVLPLVSDVTVAQAQMDRVIRCWYPIPSAFANKLLVALQGPSWMMAMI